MITIIPSILQASGQSDLETLHVQVFDNAHAERVMKSLAKAGYFNFWHTTKVGDDEVCTRYSVKIETAVSVVAGKTITL